MGVFSFVLALNQLTNGAVTVSGVAQDSSETTDGALRIAGAVIFAHDYLKRLCRVLGVPVCFTGGKVKVATVTFKHLGCAYIVAECLGHAGNSVHGYNVLE